MEISGQLHASAALPLGKEFPLHIDKESGWAPRLVCMFCRRKPHRILYTSCKERIWYYLHASTSGL